MSWELSYTFDVSGINDVNGPTKNNPNFFIEINKWEAGVVESNEQPHHLHRDYIVFLFGLIATCYRAPVESIHI